MLATALAVVAGVGAGVLRWNQSDEAASITRDEEIAAIAAAEHGSSDPISIEPTAVAAYSEGATGYAISWPQCGQALPQASFEFGIVGVTFGWPFRPSPCLAQEFAWAARGRQHAAFYVNTNYAPAENPDASLRIREACGGRGAGCEAYFYGVLLANDAFGSATLAGASAPMWWLDVQIASTWSDDAGLNAIVIHGAIDGLASHGVRAGISSTPFQWRQVAGDYEPGLPGWVAGASGTDEAARFCDGRQNFGGGHTEQIAYVDHGFEMVRSCGRERNGAAARTTRGTGG